MKALSSCVYHEWYSNYKPHKLTYLLGVGAHPTQGWFSSSSRTTTFDALIRCTYALTMIKMCIEHWLMKILSIISIKIPFSYSISISLSLSRFFFLWLVSPLVCIFLCRFILDSNFFLLILLVLTFCSDFLFIVYCFFLSCLHLYRFNLNSIIIIIREYQLYLQCIYAVHKLCSRQSLWFYHLIFCRVFMWLTNNEHISLRLYNIEQKKKKKERKTNTNKTANQLYS